MFAIFFIIIMQAGIKTAVEMLGMLHIKTQIECTWKFWIGMCRPRISSSCKIAVSTDLYVALGLIIHLNFVIL